MKFNLRSLSFISLIRNCGQIFLFTYLIFSGIILTYLVIKIKNFDKSVTNLSTGIRILSNSNQGGVDAISSLFDQAKLSSHLTTTDLIENNVNKLNTDLSDSISNTEIHLERELNDMKDMMFSINKTVNSIQLNCLLK